MSSIVHKYIIGAAFVFSCGSTLGVGTEPRVLREPVLGLRYEPAQVKFDPLARKDIANCETLQDNENSRAVWYIYARANDVSGRQYYIIGGYEIRNAIPPHLKYDTDGLGVVLFTDRGACTYIDSARQVFDDRLFDDEMPQPILKQLAADMVRRLIQAYGSTARLRTELHNQHIRSSALPPELREALKPYLVK